MPYLRISQAEIYFEEIGAGEPVVFLHNSFSRGILGFGAQMALFQQKYRCLFPDLRGHGRTTSSRDGWTVPGLADDLPEMLDGWGIERTHLVGYSVGGGVALHVASRYPDRIRSLVTIGTAGRVTPAVVANAGEFSPARLPSLRGQKYIDRLIANHYPAQRGNWQRLVSETIENWCTYPRLSMDDFGAIKAPALLIAGERDPLIGESDLVWLAERIPGAVYKIIPGAGHGPHMVDEQANLVNRLIGDFLQSQQSRDDQPNNQDQ